LAEYDFRKALSVRSSVVDAGVTNILEREIFDLLSRVRFVKITAHVSAKYRLYVVVVHKAELRIYNNGRLKEKRRETVSRREGRI